jgi:ankyrin repeat protein
VADIGSPNADRFPFFRPYLVVMPMNRSARSIEELFPVIAYARAGDLKSVKAWIDSGGPLNLPTGKKTKRQSPLQIAIDKGFLTLAEMLLEGGADPKADDALDWAVNCGRPDIAILLLDRGAKVNEVSFEQVCYTNNLDLIRLFLERGADPIDGSPFLHALNCGLQPLIGLLKELLVTNPKLQPQADAALAHYARKGNPRGVSLLIWAGAKPDAEIPADDSDDTETPLEAAVRSGNLATLKTMKPEKFPALLPRLIRAPYGDSAGEITSYLFSLGAPVNDNKDGTSTLLDLALWRVSMHSRTDGYGFSDSQKADQHLKTIEDLLANGGKFRPMDAREIRHQLKSVPCERLIRLIGILQKGSAFSNGLLLEVISTPKMRSVLGNRWASAARIAVGEPAELPPKSASKAAKPSPPQDLAELRLRAENALVAFIGSHGHIPFLDSDVSKHWTRGEFRRCIKQTDESIKEETILQDACKAIGKRLKSADLTVEKSQYYSFPLPTFTLHPDSTWNAVIREVCQTPAGEPLPLSYSAENFLALAEAGSDEWTSDDEMRRKVGGKKYARVASGLSEEIASKRGITIKVERRPREGDPHGEELQLQIIARSDPAEMLNPKTVANMKWDHPMKETMKADVDRFRDALINLILSKKPKNSEPLMLFRVHTPGGLAKVFPQVVFKPYDASRAICSLLRTVRLPEGIRIAFDLQDSAPEWWAALVPEKSWNEALVSVREYLDRPTLEKKFGLTPDAARLLEWIETRDKKEMTGNWTPVVEPAIDTEIGFSSDWPEENLPALLQMLADEISEKTTYDLSLQPWKESGDVLTRIKVSKRIGESEAMKQRLERAAKEAGIGLSEEQLGKLASAISRTGGK